MFCCIVKSRDIKTFFSILFIKICLDNIKNIEKKINFFLKTASVLKAKNKSFIIIKKGININDFPEILNIAPTLQEAKDILEMENIERDLGL